MKEERGAKKEKLDTRRQDVRDRKAESERKAIERAAEDFARSLDSAREKESFMREVKETRTGLLSELSKVQESIDRQVELSRLPEDTQAIRVRDQKKQAKIDRCVVSGQLEAASEALDSRTKEAKEKHNPYTILKEAQKLECVLIQWQTPDFNKRAMKFYNRIGAKSKNKERFFLTIDNNI